jgi:ComF family protein
MEQGTSGKGIVRNIFTAILDFFLPHFCLFCGAAAGMNPEAAVCPVCEASVTWIQEPICPCCGIAFESRTGPAHLCSNCQSQPPPFKRARAVALFEGPVLEAVHRLKYQRQMAYARPLKKWLTSPTGLEMAEAADFILPVPLHSKRLRRRGFNQALLLAQAFANDKIKRDLLIRSRWTDSQVSMDKRQRQENIHQAFGVSDPEAVAGRNVLLIDDVFTTGATVSECARVLLAAGADQVEVLTVAHAGYA